MGFRGRGQLALERGQDDRGQAGARPRLQINYAGRSRPETLICWPRSDDSLYFREYTRQLQYVHIRQQRYTLAAGDKELEPSIDEFEIPTSEGSMERLVPLIRARVKGKISELLEYGELVVAPPSNANAVEGKVVARYGKQLFYRRGGSEFAHESFQASSILSGLQQGEFGTTFEVNVPRQFHANFLAKLVGDVLAEKDSTKWKLHIVVDGQGQEIVAGCTAKHGRLRLRTVRVDQQRHINVDLVRPAAKVDIRIQATAKVVRDEPDPELADFLSSIEVIDDGRQLLRRPGRHPRYFIRRARKIQKLVYLIEEEFWAMIAMSIENFDEHEGEGGVKEMLLLEVQPRYWKDDLRAIFQQSTLAERQEKSKMLMTEFNRFLKSVWEKSSLFTSKM